MTKTIALTRGYVTIVDDVDFEKFGHLKWHASGRDGFVYAARSIRVRGRKQIVYLHRAILAAPPGIHVDHRSGDRLFNVRSNLRLATRSQNLANSRLSAPPSGYRGVHVNRHFTWSAAIAVNGKQLHLGNFGDPVAAAKAYDVAARKHFGAFARPNFGEN